MPSTVKKTTFITIAALLFSTILTTSCTDQRYYDFKGQLSNELNLTWLAGNEAESFIMVEEDIKSGILDELEKQRIDYPGAVLTSVKVNSMQFIALDETSFDYLESLEMYLVASDGVDIATPPVEAQGILIGTLEKSDRSKSSFNLKASNNELLSQIIANGNYDLHVSVQANDKLKERLKDHPVEVTLHFDVSIQD